MCRSRQVFEVAKDFWPNFLKLARKVSFPATLYVNISSHTDLLGCPPKKGLHHVILHVEQPILARLVPIFQNQTTLGAVFDRSFR